MDARPSLWVTYGAALMMNGSPLRVEEKLLAAEAALASGEDAVLSARLGGRMAALRAMVAAAGGLAEPVAAEARRALDLLEPGERAFRAFAELAQAFACLLGGDVATAVQTFRTIMSTQQAAGLSTLAVSAATSLAHLQEAHLELHAAAETWRRILQLIADPSHVYNYEAHLGLARISYEWNDLAAAQRHAEQAVQLAPLIECMCPATSLVILARVRLAAGDDAGAFALLDKAAEAARAQGDAGAGREVAAAQVAGNLHRGNVAEAARIAHAHQLPACLARAQVAQGNPSAALALLDSVRRREEAATARVVLELTVVHALAQAAKGAQDSAVQEAAGALAAAEPAGLVRLFLDEGAPMAALLARAGEGGGFAARLLAAFPDIVTDRGGQGVQPPTEALSEREIEILRLLAQGCSNQEIAERLFIALSTVKGHNQSLFGKLQAQRRTEAIARARELGLL